MRRLSVKLLRLARFFTKSFKTFANLSIFVLIKFVQASIEHQILRYWKLFSLSFSAHQYRQVNFLGHLMVFFNFLRD